MGFISIDRKIFKHYFWTEHRSYSKFEAWLDLIQLVSYGEDNHALINNLRVSWGRGQYPISYTFLAKRWCWSEHKVRRHLVGLKSDRMIVTETAGRVTILTLCNYDKYNNNGQGDGTADGIGDDKAGGRLRAGIKRKKEDESKKEDKSLPQKRDYSYLDRIISEFKIAHGSYVVTNQGKERAAAGRILQIYKDKYPQATAEETLAGLRVYFSQCVNINDTWLKTRMSLSIIVEQFNQINSILRNGGNKKDNKTASDGSSLQDVIVSQARKLGLTVE